MSSHVGHHVPIAAEDVHLIADWAQGHSATWPGAAAGCFGVADAFSFFLAKYIGAVGETTAKASSITIQTAGCTAGSRKSTRPCSLNGSDGCRDSPSVEDGLGPSINP